MNNTYKKQDYLSQKLFGTEFFNWLSFWEQFHICQKFDLDRNLITKNI